MNKNGLGASAGSVASCETGDLRVKLRALIEIWGEVAHIENLVSGMGAEAVIRRDCMNDLEEILNGDDICIERLDS